MSSHDKLWQKILFFKRTLQFKTNGHLNKVKRRTYRELTHHIHQVCIPSTLRENDPSSQSLERQTDRQKERQVKREREGGKGEVSRWRDTELDKDKVFMHVWSEEHKRVFDSSQKKVGQRISHHLLRGGRGEE